MKVFIADDSPTVRERLATMLAETREIQVIGQAQNAVEAKDSIHRLKPDAVILDIRMPDGGGIEVLQNIKKNGSPPTIIVLTNYPYPQYRKRCMDEGADFFLDKSTEFEKVLDIIRSLATARFSS